MIAFSKFHGAGNDFILIDDRDLSFPIKEKYIAHLCHRRFGIGADGLVLFQPSMSADLKMRIFNSDGKEASSCGNAMRSLLAFMQKLGFPNGRYSIELQKEMAFGEIENDITRVLVPSPSSFKTLSIDNNPAYLIDTGVEHLIVFKEELQTLNVKKEGSYLRYHPDIGEKGANINFVHREKDQLFLRTYERGVEDETLSCATGAAAAAFISHSLFKTGPDFSIFFPGGNFKVSLEDGYIAIEGSAIYVYCGSIDCRKEIIATF